MRVLLSIGLIIISQGYGTDGCLPRRTEELTDSYVPVGIQVLNHYKSQLQMYYPYAFTSMCKTGEHTMAILKSPLPDVCVAESVARINLFLIDLQREAAKKNLEDSQGLTRSVFIDMQNTSRMTAAQQFHYILKKLLREGIGGRALGCKVTEFLQDLENPDSSLFKNFQILKPLNYFK